MNMTSFIKKSLSLFILFSFFLIPANKALGVSCCIFKTYFSDELKNNRKYYYQNTDAKDISCVETTTEEECLKKRSYTMNSQMMITSRVNPTIVPSCAKHCDSKDNFFVNTLYRASCCVSTTGLPRTCKPVASDAKKADCASSNLSDINYDLQLGDCSLNPLCTNNYGKFQDLNKAIASSKKDTEEYIKNSIEKNQIKPYLGVGLPGLDTDKLEPIKLSDKDPTGRRYITIDWLAQYIEKLYSYAIGVAGVIATAMFMVAGFLWITSGGNPNSINQAKEYMKSATLGLLVLITSYLLLNFFNPAFVNLQSLQLELPELREDPDRNPTLIEACDGQFQNKSIKDTLVKKGGKTYCPDYNSLLSLPGKLGTTYINIKGSSMLVSKNVMDGLLLVEKKMQDNPSLWKDVTIQVSTQDQSIEYVSGLCQSKLQKVRVGETPTMKPEESANCAKNKHLTGKEIHISTILGDKGLDCGNLENDCRSVTNTNEQLREKIAKGTCKDSTSNCQGNLHNLMTSAGGFTRDPNRWYVFTK